MGNTDSAMEVELRSQNSSLTRKYDQLQADQKARIDQLVMSNAQMLKSMEDNNKRWQFMLTMMLQAAGEDEFDPGFFAALNAAAGNPALK